VKASDGAPLGTAYSWHFTTQAPPPPDVSATSPADMDIGVSPASDVRATFTRALDPATVKKDFTPENKPRLLKWREALSKLTTFDAATLGNTLQSLAAELGVKPGVLVHPTRLACTGKAIGPSLYHLLEVLGKERVLARLDRVLSLPG